MAEKIKLFSLTKKDFEMQAFTVGGHGGSGKDTSNTGVRFIHRPSKAVGECREERSQLANKKKAFERLAHSKEFQKWLRIEAARISGKLADLERRVDDMMRPENIKEEIF